MSDDVPRKRPIVQNDIPTWSTKLTYLKQNNTRKKVGGKHVLHRRLGNLEARGGMQTYTWACCGHARERSVNGSPGPW